MLDLFIDGIAAIATPDTLALMILGVIVGIIFGSVPGLTAVTGIALFLPVTYSLGPIKGMALLMAIYIGAVSGGLIAAILTLGLNFVSGYLGQTSLGHAAFYGIGAYTTAVLLKYTNISFWITIPVGFLLAALVSIPLAMASHRVKGQF